MIFNKINNMFNIIENKKITSKLFFIILITLIFDILIRHMFEINFIDTRSIANYKIHYLAYILDEIKFFYENFSYFILLFLLMNFTVSVIVNDTISKTINFAVYFYPFIIIPPILDYFIFHKLFKLEYVSKFIEYGYSYGSIQNYLNNILTLSWYTGDTSFGISFLVTIGVTTSSIYVYMRAKKNKILKSILTFIIIDIIIMTISTPDLIFGNRVSNYQEHTLLPLFYYFPIIIISSIIVYREKIKLYEYNYIISIYFIFNIFCFYFYSFSDIYIYNISFLIILNIYNLFKLFTTKNYFYLNILLFNVFILSGFLLEFNILLYIPYMFINIILIIIFLLISKISNKNNIL